jgi:ABC-type multidrug transport system ATPase subunit
VSAPERLHGVASSPVTKPVVAAEGLRKRFGRQGRWVLDGVDLRVEPSSIAVVLGGNGSGKSTLLRLLSGLSRPSEGRVLGPPFNIGFVPDRLPSRLRLTAWQYVTHMARIRGVDPATIQNRAGLLFERLALTPGPDARIGTLSKGNSQKVALAQALLSPVALLILDEPFSALDEATGDAVQRLLSDARDAGTGVLLSAHRQAEVSLADQVWELEDGRITGRPQPTAATAAVGHPVTLVLTPPDGPVDAAHMIGAIGRSTLESTTNPRRLTVVVDRSAVDRTLRRALEAGWSVLAVTPGDTSPPPAD